MKNNDIPTYFRRCVAADCKAAEQCLRHQAFAVTTEADKDFWVINPKVIQPEAGTECPHYCSAAPITMARGFKNTIASLPAGNLRAVSAALTQLFGQRTYYKLRRGERTITPAQQATIAAVLQRYGASTPVSFDETYDAYAWE